MNYRILAQILFALALGGFLGMILKYFRIKLLEALVIIIGGSIVGNVLFDWILEKI